jgi:dCTP deaminase
VTRSDMIALRRGILNDAAIAELCQLLPHEGDPMIAPFVPMLTRYVLRGGEPVHARFEPNGLAFGDCITQQDLDEGIARRVISFGLSSFGYDLRAGDSWQVFDPLAAGVIDPKRFDPELLRPAMVHEDPDGGRFVLVPANSYALCASVERFNMPQDVVGIAVGKSTYARCGIIVNVTPLEPGWRGHLTIEISNDAPRAARIYVGEGLLQVQFWRGERPGTTYADRGGKYQDQPAGPVPARL